MKFIFRTLILLIVVAGICIISCPKFEDHSEALKQEVKRHFEEEFTNETTGNEGIAFLASSLYTRISSAVFDNRLAVDNYFLFSVGSINLDGRKEVVSLGILNHVFTEIPEEIEDRLETL